MSLSNPRESSPVRKYFKVKASTGDVIHWDRSQSKEVAAELPFRFIVLDVLNTVGGFNEASGSGIWANEVRSNTDVLRVRTKNGPLIEGPYGAIKDRLRGLGGKFANSVYIAYREGGELVLGNIQFIGASVSEWFDFRKGRHFDSDPGVAITGFEARQKGRTDYFIPLFEGLTVAPADLAIAQGLDEELQLHLGSHKPEANEEAVEPAYAGGSQSSSFSDEPPF